MTNATFWLLSVFWDSYNYKIGCATILTGSSKARTILSKRKVFGASLGSIPKTENALCFQEILRNMFSYLDLEK